MMNMEQRGHERGKVDTALLKRIQELSFVKTETELYLDGHPDCVAAIEHYRKTVKELRALMDEYEGAVGAIRAENEMGDGWSWISKPWPWQIGVEE